MTDPTCAERINDHKASRLEDWRNLLDRVASDEASDDDREDVEREIHEYPLGISTHRIWRVDLSTGGPGDWIEVHVDQENDPTRIEYHFNDWFDHASVTLSGEEYEIAERFARYVTADFYTEQGVAWA